MQKFFVLFFLFEKEGHFGKIKQIPFYTSPASLVAFELNKRGKK